MPRKLNFNGKLVHPTTGEEIICGIRSRIRNFKSVYWNVHLIPLDSYVGKLVPTEEQRFEAHKKKCKENGWTFWELSPYLTREVDKKLHKHPFLLVWVNDNKTVPVRFVSCWYRGKKHVNIRVKEIGALEYCDRLPKEEVSNER